MYCSHCGARIPDDSQFCSACGNPTAAPPNTRAQASAYVPQTQQAPQQTTSSNGIARVLTIISIILASIIVCLTLYVLLAGRSQPQDGAIEAADLNVELADAYEQVLSDPSSIDFMGNEDASSLTLGKTYNYVLVDLHNDGTPDLVASVDGTAHTKHGDVACDVARVLVYNESTDTVEPIGGAIKSGSGITIGISQDKHGIVLRTEDDKNNRTVSTVYTLVDGADASTKQEDGQGTPVEFTPNYKSVKDLSLIEKLRAGTWTDADAIK